MLTTGTMGDLGIKGQSDPKQSITQGTVYAAFNQEKSSSAFPSAIARGERSQTYNAGFGHLEDVLYSDLKRRRRSGHMERRQTVTAPCFRHTTSTRTLASAMRADATRALHAKRSAIIMTFSSGSPIMKRAVKAWRQRPIRRSCLLDHSRELGLC